MILNTVLDPKLIGLLTIGIIMMIIGVSSITNAQFVEINNLNQYDNILQPTPVILRWDTPIPENLISSFELIKIHFRTMDVFAIGFPVDYKIDITVREPNMMKELYLIYREPDMSISHVNASNFDEFLQLEKSLGNVLEIKKISPTKFYLENTREFQAQHEYGFSLLGKLENNKIEPLDLTHEVLAIDESVKKIQIDVARAELISVEKQYSNSLIIQGFSAIIIGWIPLELFIQLYREKRKQIQEKVKGINAIISEFLSVQESYKNKKPVLVKKEENRMELNPVIFSNIGLENAIINGVYQEMGKENREEVGRIYLQFKSLTQLGEQIKSLAFQNTIDKSEKITNLTNLANAYEMDYKKTNADIEKVLPELKKYLDNLR